MSEINWIQNYNNALELIKACDDSWEIIQGFETRDQIYFNWDNLAHKEKLEIKKLDEELIQLISGDWGYDFKYVAEKKGYSKETHWWYWLAIEPEVAKYAQAA